MRLHRVSGLERTECCLEMAGYVEKSHYEELILVGSIYQSAQFSLRFSNNLCPPAPCESR